MSLGRSMFSGRVVLASLKALACLALGMGTARFADAAIFVTSGPNVLKYSDSGVSEGTFATLPGTGMNAIDVKARDGMLYVTNFNPAGVYRYDLNTGAYIDQLVSSVPSRIYKFDFGPADNNLYITGGDTNAVYKYSGTTGALLSTFATGAGVALNDVRFGPDGYLYTAGQSNGFIRRYNATTGALVYSWDTTVGANRTGGCRGMDFSPDGTRLYIADSNFGLRYITLADNSVTTLLAPANFAANDIKFGADGFLYGLARGGNKDIRKYDPNTGALLGTVVTGLPGSEWAMAMIAVPEPTFLTGLGAMGALIVRRRR